ncbi:MAG: hypothetical protein U0Y82_14050 [Thermoleophilia bacterium]
MRTSQRSSGLGRLIVGRYHGPDAALAAEEHFNRVHRDHGAPEEMPQHAS